MLRKALFPFLFAGLATPGLAQEDSSRDAFIEANILGIFYHELGHGVIDLMQVPIFGQEEDAADVMSVLMISWLFDEEAAKSIAYDSAFGYINDPEGTEEVPYWDLHGPDEQRYYNHICLFYGANPDDRDDLANDLGLPDDRAETCPEEYEQAANSWGIIFDEMDAQEAGVPMVFEPGEGEGADVANALLANEVASMNGDIKLPVEVTVRVDACGEPNAFYDPSDQSITFCSEFVAHLGGIYDQVSAN